MLANRAGTVRCKLAKLLLIGFAIWPMSFANGQSNVANFLSNVPESHSEVFVINEPAAHLERLLQHRGLRRVFTSETFSKFPNATIINPAKLTEKLEASRPFYPKHIAIAGTETVYVTLQEIAEFFVRFNLAFGIAESAVQVPETELAQLAGELRSCAEKIRLPEIVLVADWQDDSTAEMIFSTINSQLRGLREQYGVKLRNEETATLVRAKLADFVDFEIVANALANAGIDDDDDKMVRALLEINFDLRLDRIENGIRLALGTIEPAGPSLTKLASLRDQPELICFGQWKLERLKQFRDQLTATLDHWENTELGRAFREVDTEDVWSSFRSLEQILNRAPSAGYLNVVQNDHRLQIDLIQQGTSATENLIGHRILQFVPADMEFFHIDSVSSLTEALANDVEQTEGRLATRELSAELSQEYSESANLETISSEYYQNFAKWREIVLTKLRPCRSSPWVIMGAHKGVLDAFDLTLIQLDDAHFHIEHFPIPQFAAVAQIDPGSNVPALIDQAYSEFAASFAKAFGQEPPSSFSTMVNSELSLGVEAKEFSMAWLEQASLAKLDIRGDFRLHYFVQDDYFCISTSPELSRRILDKNRDSLSLQGEANEVLVSAGQLPGESLVQYVTRMVELPIKLFESSDLEGFGSSGNSRDMLAFIADLIGLLDIAQWQSTQQGPVRQTLITIDFVTE